MIIDIVYAVLLLLAVVKGFQRGLIVGVFSFVAVIVGLAAALKLSVLAAGYIGSAVNISASWLPFISFIVVFIGVVLLIRLGANAIEAAAKVVMLGWLNRLGGILLYVALYTLVFSVVLFYAGKMEWIQQQTMDASFCYAYISPMGPKVIGALGQLIPWFRDMFADLSVFFDNVSKQVPQQH